MSIHTTVREAYLAGQMTPADLIAMHRRMFGGFTMMADDKTEQPQQQQSENNPDEFKSEHSRSSVLADLANLRADNKSMRAENDGMRSENKEMRAQLDALKPLQELAAKLAPEAPKDDATAALEAVNARLDAAEKRAAEAEHRALVAQHGEGLTDADKAILTKITDPALMDEVAKRLREASATPPAKNGRHIPKPDPSTGSGGGRDGRRTGSVAQARDEYLARHEPKK